MRLRIRGIACLVMSLSLAFAGKTVAESPIQGQWFDSHGKVYRFLSDGTMGDEGEYPDGSYSYSQQTLTITENGSKVLECNAFLGEDVLTLRNSQNENINTLYLWKDEFLMDNSRNNPGPNDPIGCIDIVATGEGAFYVAGWVFDPDKPGQTVYLDVYLNGAPGTGTLIGSFPADTLRQDVDDVYGCGSWHGISFTCSDIGPYIDTNEQSLLYIYAKNLETGEDVELGQGRIGFSFGFQDLIDFPGWVREEVQSEAASSSAEESGDLVFTDEEASKAVQRYGNEQFSSQGGNYYISDEYLEDTSTYVVWYRWPTGFSGKYTADLQTGDVYETGPYWGRDPVEDMPLTTSYAFNIRDYVVK